MKNHAFFLLIALLLAGCTQAPPLDSVEEKKGQMVDEPLETEPAESSPSSFPNATSQGASDAMTLAQKAKSLIGNGQFEDGYQTAKDAMTKFTEQGDDLAWLILESIDADDKRIDVHFNMGERERQMPDRGIVRPISFRVWSSEEPLELLRVVDFEISRFAGESLTGAIGESTEEGHVNHGIMDIDSSYEDIRKRAIELIGK